ncbi:hypothetical protein CK805_00005 [Brucella abortus]|nr:hypothetical protein CK805_00005 [Brucella abortus]
MNYRRVGRRRHDRLSKGSPWVCAHGDLTAILRSRKRFGREFSVQSAALPAVIVANAMISELPKGGPKEAR